MGVVRIHITVSISKFYLGYCYSFFLNKLIYKVIPQTAFSRFPFEILNLVHILGVTDNKVALRLDVPNDKISLQLSALNNC